MVDNLKNKIRNGRRPQKNEMEDNLKKNKNGKRPKKIKKMEDDLQKKMQDDLKIYFVK
jgi:hypothetical protein